MQEPGVSFENSAVPFPAILYTSRTVPSFRSTSQMEIGLGRSLAPSAE